MPTFEKSKKRKFESFAMKPLFRLCFLVLIISPVSRGQTPTVLPSISASSSRTPSPGHKPNEPATSNDTSQTGTTRQTLDKNETSPTQTEPTPLTSTVPTIVEVTTPKDSKTPRSKEVTNVAKTTAGPPAPSSKAGYVVLVLILIVIIILCIILYMLRRASRTYSFDLHAPGPSRHQGEPTGTFGQVYVDDLNHPSNDIEMTDLTTPPVPNGTSPEPEEKSSIEENAVPQDPPETNDVRNSPSSSFSSSSDDDRAEKTSNKLSSSNLFFDAPEEQQQNENNNNPCEKQKLHVGGLPVSEKPPVVL